MPQYRLKHNHDSFSLTVIDAPRNEVANSGSCYHNERMPIQLSKKLAISLMLLVGVGVIVGAVIIMSMQIWGPDRLPQRVTEAVDFPVLFPEKVPTGFEYDPDSVSVSGNIVNYNLRYDSSKTLAVTVQSTADAPDFSQFSGSEEFTTMAGRAFIVDFPGRTTGALIGEKSWLLVNAPDTIATTKLREFLESLR